MDTQQPDIFTIDLTNDIRLEFVVRVRVHDDEAAIILKGHLLIEYLINKLIEQKCKAPDKILDDPRNYPFSVKLQFVCSMGLLPDYLHENIMRINRLRNKLAHNLDFELDRNNMTIENWIGLFFAIRRLHMSQRIASGDFLLRFDEMLFQYHNEVHNNLRPGSEWAERNSGPSSKEDWIAVERYMGMFERIKVLLDDKLIDISRSARGLMPIRQVTLWNVAITDQNGQTCAASRRRC